MAGEFRVGERWQLHGVTTEAAEGWMPTPQFPPVPLAEGDNVLGSRVTAPIVLGVAAGRREGSTPCDCGLPHYLVAVQRGDLTVIGVCATSHSAALLAVWSQLQPQGVEVKPEVVKAALEADRLAYTGPAPGTVRVRLTRKGD